MQKVVYSISKVNKDEKLKGVGYLIEGNLLIPSTSQRVTPIYGYSRTLPKSASP